VLLAVVSGTIAVTVASRNVPVQIPRKVMGRGRIREGQKSFIPLRLNSAGVMPIIFAQSIIVIPGTFATFAKTQWLKDLANWFQYGTWPYYVTYALLIVFFTYFYTAIIFNPDDVAENMRKYGGFVPGIRPGKRTAEHIDAILARITLAGALYLAAIALLPEFMLTGFKVAPIPFIGDWLDARLPAFVTQGMNVQFYFGGTSLLIIVGVAMDTVQQIESQLIMRHYDGFMKKTRVRGRR
jgi:preprotein translocase subunit SecY